MVKRLIKIKLPELLTRVDNFQDQIDDLQKSDIGAINYQLERLAFKNT